MSVVEALRSELERMPEHVAGSATAATALVMAAQLDDSSTSATSKSMCAAKLLDAMAILHDLAPSERMADGIDDLTAHRAARLAASAS